MTMLDRMRRHRNVLKWSLALVVVAFIALYASDFANTGGSITPTSGLLASDVVAEVEGEEITASEFQQRYLNQIQAYQNAYGGNVTEQLLRQLGIDQQILQQMVDEQAAYAEAQRQGIRVSDAELAQQIFSIPGLQENGQFIGEARYEQLLRSQRPPMTKADFEENLRRSMVIDKFRAALTDWMAISENELEREFRQRNEKVKLELVALTAQQFRDKVTVTDQDVAAYYEGHKAEYRKGEQRKIRYLLIDRDQLQAKVQVSPADVQQFYNQNIQQYQTPEQIRASHILLKTEGKDKAAVRKVAEDVLRQARMPGADFAALATKYSEDEASKASGGDLGAFGRGRMVPEFENPAFALQPGQISDIVESQFGFHIIKLVEKTPAMTRTLDEVRAQIQEQLASQRTDQQIAERTAQMDARITKPADLDTVARESQMTVQESGFFGREDPVPGLGPAPAVAAEAFQLEDNQVSKATASPRGPVYIAVSSKKDPYVPQLDEVRDRVREDVIRTKATELSKQRAAQIAAALKSARDFTAAAKAQGLEAKTTDLVARSSPLPDVGVNQAVDKVVFALPVGGVSDPITTNDATVIARVTERDEVTPDEYRKEKEAFREEILSERRNRFFSAYMEKAKQNMSIEIRPDVVRRALGTS